MHRTPTYTVPRGSRPRSRDAERLRPIARVAAAVALAAGFAAIAIAGVSLAGRIREARFDPHARPGFKLAGDVAFAYSADLVGRIAPDMEQTAGQIDLVKARIPSGRMVRRWEFDSTDRTGETVGHAEWNPETGLLVRLSRQEREADVATMSRLGRDGALITAAAWMRIIQEHDPDRGRSRWRLAERPLRNGDVWSLRVTDGSEYATLRVGDRTGHLIMYTRNES